MARQPAKSFSNSSHFHFNRAGVRTSNVAKIMKIPFALLTVVVVGLQGFARGEFIDASLSAKLTPIADANLKAMRKTLKEFGDGMKDFRQRLLFSANRTISF